jgi:hypothetical protein
MCDEFEEGFNKTFDTKEEALQYRLAIAAKFMEQRPDAEMTFKDYLNLIYLRTYTCGTLAELVALKPNHMIYTSGEQSYSAKRQWWTCSKTKHICPTKRDIDEFRDRCW